MTTKSQSFKDIFNLRLELLNKEAYLRREEFYDSSGCHSSTIKGFCTVSVLKDYHSIHLDKLDIDLMGVLSQRKYCPNPKKHSPKLVDSKVFQIHSTYDLRDRDKSLAVYTYPLEFNLTDDMMETVDLTSNRIRYFVCATLHFNKNKSIIVKIPINLIKSVKYSDPVLMEANWKNLLKYEISCDDNVLYLDDEISVDFLFKPKFPNILLKNDIVKLKTIKLFMIQTYISSSIDDDKAEHVSYQRLRFAITCASFVNGNKKLTVTENGDLKFNLRFKLLGLQHLNSQRRLYPSFYNKNTKFSVQHQLKASVEFDVKDYQGLQLPWNLDDDSVASSTDGVEAWLTNNNSTSEMEDNEVDSAKCLNESPELAFLQSKLDAQPYRWKSCSFSVRLPLFLLPAGSKDGNIAPPDYSDIVNGTSLDSINSLNSSSEDLSNATDRVFENSNGNHSGSTLSSSPSPCSSTASVALSEEHKLSSVKTIFKQLLFKNKTDSYHMNKALMDKYPPNYCFV